MASHYFGSLQAKIYCMDNILPHTCLMWNPRKFQKCLHIQTKMMSMMAVSFTGVWGSKLSTASWCNTFNQSSIQKKQFRIRRFLHRRWNQRYSPHQYNHCSCRLCPSLLSSHALLYHTTLRPARVISSVDDIYTLACLFWDHSWTNIFTCYSNWSFSTWKKDGKSVYAQ